MSKTITADDVDIITFNSEAAFNTATFGEGRFGSDGDGDGSGYGNGVDGDGCGDSVEFARAEAKEECLKGRRQHR